MPVCVCVGGGGGGGGALGCTCVELWRAIPYLVVTPQPTRGLPDEVVRVAFALVRVKHLGNSGELPRHVARTNAGQTLKVCTVWMFTYMCVGLGCACAPHTLQCIGARTHLRVAGYNCRLSL